jgi:hypothetical protein
MRILLVIELFLLVVFLMLFLTVFFGFGFQLLFIFLLVVVCLGGFSVSLLVSLARFSGRDFWYFRFVF